VPAWVVMREEVPLCVVFSEEEAWHIVDRDDDLRYQQVSMGPHPSVALMDFQMQQTNAWRWRADKYETIARRLDAEYAKLEGAASRLRKRLDTFKQVE